MFRTTNINARQAMFAALLTAVLLFAALLPQQLASAATLSDGVWSQGGAPGTTTVTYTTDTAITAGDKIVLTFPSEATLDAAGTNITMTGQTTPTRVNDAAANTITITTDGAVATTTAVTITMTDALTAYTDTTYIQQSLAINHTSSSDTAIDSGLAIITNTNTTTVTASVPIFLTLALDDNTMDLGVLTSGAVSTQTQQYTLNTNNAAGAVVRFEGEATGLDDGGGNDINKVADGTVTAGSEEYGVSMTSGAGIGTMNLVSPYDTGDDPTPGATATIFANSNSAPITNGTIDVTYKASIDANSIPGTYDEVITVTTVANP